MHEVVAEALLARLLRFPPEWGLLLPLAANAAVACVRIWEPAKEKVDVVVEADYVIVIYRPVPGATVPFGMMLKNSGVPQNVLRSNDGDVSKRL